MDDPLGGLLFPREHLDEGGLPQGVGPHHPKDRPSVHRPCTDRELERGERLGQLGVLRHHLFALDSLPGCLLAKGDGMVPESDVLLGQVPVQESIDPSPRSIKPRDYAVGSRLSIDYLHVVGNVIKKRYVVLDHEHCLPGLRDAADEPGHGQPLVDVVVGRRLVEKVKVSLLQRRCRHRNPLELSSAKVGDLLLERLPQVQGVNYFVEPVLLIHLLQ